MKFLFQIYVFITIFWQVSSNIPDLPISDECPRYMKSFFVEENSTREICDCKDTFLYHHEDDSCYDAYRQGPCPSGHYFMLPPGELVAKCEKNPCEMDGLVPYQGKCHILWESGEPCKNNVTYLGINQDFQIECSSRKYIENWEILKTSKSCPLNSYLHATTNNSYVCQCRESFIFLENNRSCQQVYRQGSCLEGNYLIASPGEKVPRCEKNPCQRDGLVPFKGGCHQIYKAGNSCPDFFQILSVAEDNFSIQCISLCDTEYSRELPPCLVGILSRTDIVIKTQIFGGGIIKAPKKVCPAGSRRIFSGECKKQYY